MILLKYETLWGAGKVDAEQMFSRNRVYFQNKESPISDGNMKEFLLPESRESLAFLPWRTMELCSRQRLINT